MNSMNRTKIYNLLNKPEAIYARSVASAIAVLIFVAIDMVCLYSVWNKVITENPVMLIMRCLGCAIGLDVPLSIGAMALKYNDQGLKSRRFTNIIFYSSLVAFALTFICFFVFLFSEKELAFDIGSNDNISFDAGETTEATLTDKTPIIIAAIFGGILPLITSISSFVISYFGFDPLRIRIANKERALIKIQESITALEKVLAEAPPENIFADEKRAYEDERYSLHKSYIDAIEDNLNVTASMAVANQVGTVQAVSASTDQELGFIRDVPDIDSSNTMAKLLTY